MSSLRRWPLRTGYIKHRYPQFSIVLTICQRLYNLINPLLVASLRLDQPLSILSKLTWSLGARLKRCKAIDREPVVISTTNGEGGWAKKAES